MIAPYDGPAYATDGLIQPYPRPGDSPTYMIGPQNGPEWTRPLDPLHWTRSTQLEVQRVQVVPWGFGGLSRDAWNGNDQRRLVPIIVTTQQTAQSQRNAPFEGTPRRGTIIPTFVNDPALALYGF